MKESGYPALDVSSVYYFFAPAGTPASIVQQLNAAAVTALASPAVVQRLAQQGATAQSASVENTVKKISGEYERWSKVVKPTAK
jgi:tripartite-type tricarboxylate transporter receptor subunit TctC